MTPIQQWRAKMLDRVDTAVWMVEECHRRALDATATATRLQHERDAARGQARRTVPACPKLAANVRRLDREQLGAHREAVELLGLLMDWLDIAERVAREALVEPEGVPEVRRGKFRLARE